MCLFICLFVIRLTPSSLAHRLALAGRRPKRLHRIRQKILDDIRQPHSSTSASDGTAMPPTLPRPDPAATDAALTVIDTPIDASDYNSVLMMARQAHVVVSTIRASDAALISNTVAACVEAGASYTDLCALPGEENSCMKILLGARCPPPALPTLPSSCPPSPALLLLAVLLAGLLLCQNLLNIH